MIKLLTRCLTFLFIFQLSKNLNAQIITTIAGGTLGYSGDGGPAISSQLTYPEGVCVDDSGNVYISDAGNNRIRKISASTGFINTIAGTGTAGYSGDSGQAVNAEINQPIGIALSRLTGDVYFAEYGNNTIRKVNQSTGLISTVAGTGIAGYSGDNGPAINAKLYFPLGVCLDTLDNVYFSDAWYGRVRKVEVATGIITTIVGNGISGYNGDGILATNAQLNYPTGVCLDDSSNLYITDCFNSRVRKVNAITGLISTIAGNGTSGFSGDGGIATSATLTSPAGVFVDDTGHVYISVPNNRRIRKVNASTGIITTIAGNGSGGFAGDGGLATDAKLNNPKSPFFDKQGNLYIADSQNNRIRKVVSNITAIKNSGGLSEISIYPNPANELVNITGITGATSIRMYDVIGNLVMQKETDVNTTIETNQFENGIYLLIVKSEKVSVNKIEISK